MTRSDETDPASVVTLQKYVPMSDFLTELNTKLPSVPLPANMLSSLNLILSG